MGGRQSRSLRPGVVSRDGLSGPQAAAAPSPSCHAAPRGGVLTGDRRPDSAPVREGVDRGARPHRLDARGGAAFGRLPGARGKAPVVARYRRHRALRRPEPQGRGRLGRLGPRRGRAGRAPRAPGEPRRRPRLDGRSLPRRVHRPRALRAARRPGRGRQRRNARALRRGRSRPGNRRRPPRRAERDDGRPGRRHPRRPRRLRPQRGRHPRLLGQVRLGPLRPLPGRRRGDHLRRRRSQGLSAGSAQPARGARGGAPRRRRRGGHRHGEAGPRLPGRHRGRAGRGQRSRRRLSRERRVLHGRRPRPSGAGSTARPLPSSISGR